MSRLLMATILGVCLIAGAAAPATGAVNIKEAISTPGMSIPDQASGSGDGRIHVLPTLSSPSLKNGERATIQAVVKSLSGVVSVEAAIEKEGTVESAPVATMALLPAPEHLGGVNADSTMGLWQTTWQARDLEEAYYCVAITVTDSSGHTYTDRSLRFSDPIAGNNVVGNVNYPNGGMQRLEGLVLSSGEDNIGCAIVDHIQGYAWFGTYTSPGRVVKVALGTGATPPVRVGAVTLSAGEDNLVSAAMDPTYAQAYFGTDTNPGRVVKINLGVGAAPPTRVGVLSLPSGEGYLRSSVIDYARGYVYYGTNVSGFAGRVVKVKMNLPSQAPSRIGAATCDPGENELTCAVIDTVRGQAYFGTNTSPGYVVKVSLETGDFAPIRIGSVALNAGESNLTSAIIDLNSGYAWFGTNTSPGRVVKVRLGAPAEAPTRVGATTLNAGESLLRSASIDVANGHAYFICYTSPGRLIKVRLGVGMAAPTRVGAISLNTGENTPRTCVMDTFNGYVYCGAYTSPGRVVRVATSHKGFVKGTEFDMVEPGVLESVHFYSHVPDGSVRLGLYSKGTPPALLWESADIPNEIQGWIDAPVDTGSPSALTLTAGQYYLAWQVYSTASVPSYALGEADEGFFVPYEWNGFPAALQASTTPTLTTDRWSAFITYDGPPVPPGDPGATAIGTDRITWIWTDNSDNETGFKVYAGPGDTAPGTVTHTTAADVEQWEQTGLGTNTQHAFQVAGTNTIGDSVTTANFSAWTLASVPIAPVASNPSPTSLDIALAGGDGNPAYTEYALYCVTTAQWVQADGTLASSAAWQTSAAWGATTIVGLEGATRYDFVARARNGENVETADSDIASGWTQATLTYVAGPGGAISGDAVQYVNYGDNGTAVGAVPNPCMSFVDWSDTATDNPRTDTNVTGNVTVTANFADLTPPVITLVGNAVININCGGVYADPGATASDSCDGNITAAIVVTNPVNTGVAGTYIVRYNVSDAASNPAMETTRAVNVIDTTPPVITLLGGAVADVDCGFVYTDAGATASDACDGDLTAAIAVDNPVDTAVPGTYIVRYNVSDAASNAATEETRMVNVADTTPPIITMFGAATVDIQCGSTYVDPGAGASDACDGDISAAIITVNNVNTDALGTYTVTYDVSDAASNGAPQKVRTVNVIDTKAPFISLLGDNPLALECSTPYSTPGVFAWDACDGLLTAQVAIDDSLVNPDVIGTYLVTYSVDDSEGNHQEVVRTVDVVDTTAPVITITGANPVTVECGGAYSDAGATATDLCDGDLTAAITTANNVDTGVAGAYAVTYNVSDAEANAAVEAVRVVNVVDTTPPVILLDGANPQTINVGDPYTELGATASDVCDGDLTAAIVIDAGAVNTNVVGTYYVAYDVSDSSLNPAVQVTRQVDVVDTMQPYVADVVVETGWTVLITFSKAMGAGALNASNYTLTGSGAGVLSSTPGSASLVSGGTYRLAWDCPGIMTAGGDITITVNGSVMDIYGNSMTAPMSGTDSGGAVAALPVITITGANPATVECGAGYADQGATALDACGANLTAAIAVTDPVDSNVPGTYAVLYNVSDAAGNAAIEAARTVDVVDTTPPVITLLGNASINIECGGIYNDAGATAADACDGDLTAAIMTTNPVDANVPGVYTVRYNVSDGTANAAAEVTRTVTVADALAPVITLSGSSDVNVECGTAYSDAGATAVDVCDGDLTAAIVVTNPVNTAVPGVYTVRFNVSDGASNAATEETRTVTVADTIAPVITLLGVSPTTVECGTSYTDAGATAADSCDGDLTSSLVVGGDVVDSNTVGQYIVTYNVTDAALNTATQVSRTVNVVDTTAPVITLLGDNPQIINLNDTYSELGATALDSCEGDVSGAIVIDASAVNTAVAGEYGVTYNVSDSESNAATETTRSVFVVETSNPYVLSVQVLDAYTVQVRFSKSMGLGVTSPSNYIVSGSGRGTLSATPANITGSGDTYELTWSGCPDAMRDGGDITITVNSIVEDDEGNQMAAPFARTHTGGAIADIPVITLLGDDPATVQCGMTYTDAGATAVDACGANLNAAIVTTSDVDTNVLGAYTVAYNVSDAAGNAALEITRAVNVVDTTPPVITRLGAASENVECGTVYNDAGATAADACDGDLTAVIVTVNDVDTDALGAYTVTYNVADAQSNAAVEVTRTVNVVDTKEPFITLLGDNPLTIQCGAAYVSPGAFAWDLCEGDLTTSIDIDASDVDTDVIGSYTVRYNVSDGEGNAAAEATRAVDVVDTTPPVITRLGNATATVQCGSPYTDAGATALDGCDGSLTASIVTVNDVDTDVPGSYLVTYNVSDAASNAATEVTRTVNVVDTTAPVITREGSATVSVECGDAYTDAGATATDSCDGDLTAEITTTNPVDTAVTGLYTVRYNVADAASNAALEVTRAVNVVDTTPPVLTRLGDETVTVECGSVYTDAGATATDSCGGDRTSAIVTTNPVNTAAPGAYTVRYNVSDAAANAAAEVTRTVNVADTTPPVLTLLGDTTVTVECNTAYTDAGATASDICDGNLTASITTTNPVDTAAPGAYTVRYNVSDGAANAATEVTRTVNVVDTVPPVITRLGDALVNVECGDTYTDAGATATDVCDGDLTASIAVVESVNMSVPGVYLVTYNVSDAALNAATEVTRIVNVADTTPPTIALVGDDTVSVECKAAYVDAGATATDVCGGDLTASIMVANPVNTSVPGAYTVRYNVSDAAANAATEATRTVNVVDTTPPAITLLGNATVTVECGNAYVDAGATASDICGGNLTSAIVTVSDVNTGAVGSYTVAYNVSDAAANPAPEVTRAVNVVDTTAPVLTINGPSSVLIECGAVEEYQDLGATAWDNCDGDLTGSVLADTSSVDVNAVGAYIVTYNVSDVAANPALMATRTVNVVDTEEPELMLLGANPLPLECGDSYLSPGAFAWDLCDGNITAAISIDASLVDASVLGLYTVSYSVSDSEGNSAETIRDVEVVDTEPPVITLLGANPATVECGDLYTDAGATALDACGGDMTAAIVLVNNVMTAVAGAYSVTYDVTDGEGNAAPQVVRLVNVVDTTAPVLTLLGNAYVEIEQGSVYTDAGATATDGCEGILNASIVVGGDTVDTDTVGTYIVTYNVQDRFGNAAAEITREVVVTDAPDPLTVTPLSDISLEEGASYDWSVIASNGIGEITYQWQRLEDTEYVNVEDGPFDAGEYAGATTNTLRFLPFTETMAGTYRVEVTDDRMTVYAGPADVIYVPPFIPAAGAFGLIAFAAAAALVGVTALRRRK